MAKPHPHAFESRRSKRGQAETLGIDPAFIAALVDRFYARVRSDPVLGPIFAAPISDWPHHLERMRAFWGSILRESGGYSCNPMLKHVAIPGIGDAEFGRWLDLFGQTLTELERDPAATALIARKAQTIADSLLTAIRYHRDGRRDPLALKGQSHV